MSDPTFSHSDSIEIAASPDAVYGLVTDMARYGEWSPQNTGGTWRDGGSAKVGDWFEGSNKAGKMEWKAAVEITEATPGQEFGFWTEGRKTNMAHWRYELQPSGAGTKLTEHYALYDPPEVIAKGGKEAVDGWCEGIKANISTMLANLKKAAES